MFRGKLNTITKALRHGLVAATLAAGLLLGAGCDNMVSGPPSPIPADYLEELARHYGQPCWSDMNCGKYLVCKKSGFEGDKLTCEEPECLVDQHCAQMYPGEGKRCLNASCQVSPSSCTLPKDTDQN